MPKVEFYYFPIKALGESIRLLLAYGGQKFEDNRVTLEKWPEYKPLTPFGQIPVLVIDGKQYTQSLAIGRYLGRKYGLSGADLEEDFEIDQNVDFINDIRAKAAVVAYEFDEQLKKKKHEDFSKNAYPGLLSKLNSIAEKNNGHIALGKLTWADFIFAGMFDYLKCMMQDSGLDQKYPALKKVVDKVYALPQLQAYLKQAPVPTEDILYVR
nr:glutathione S-transferase sigma 6 [Conogethes punctiferalis]